MRFELPEQAKTTTLDMDRQLAVPPCCEGQPDLEDLGRPAFCIPADNVHCTGCRWDAAAGDRGQCFRPDCEALFTQVDIRRLQQQWSKPSQPKLIITAGPERSGSTWLYNAVRLLFQHAKCPLDAYWCKSMTEQKLDARGAGRPGSSHILIKTHAWSDSWDYSRATHVFVTHRDLRQVLASYRRMTWEWELPDDYVTDHMRWKEKAELDIAFEDIIARPEELLRELGKRLGLDGQVYYARVLHDLCNLPVPKDWVDPVTQIWPNHISTPYMEARKTASLQEAQLEGLEPVTPSSRARLDELAANRLLERFPDFFSIYGYSF